MKKWEIRNRSREYQNRIMGVSRLDCFHPDKQKSHDFYVMNTFSWINVVAITSSGEFILVKQHRLGSDEISIETPGGVIEGGENPDECSRRELLEETGYRGTSIHLLKELWVNPAIMSNRISFFLIDGCELFSGQNLDDAEDIEIMLASADDVASMVRNGTISHSIAITALGLYFMSGYNRFRGITF